MLRVAVTLTLLAASTVSASPIFRSTTGEQVMDLSSFCSPFTRQSSDCRLSSRGCCRAFNAKCISCTMGQTEEELCAQPVYKDSLRGCDKFAVAVTGTPTGSPTETPTGSPIETPIGSNVTETRTGSPTRQARACCKALTPRCVGCVLGVDADEVCQTKGLLQLCNAQARAVQGLIVSEGVEGSGNGTSITGSSDGSTGVFAGAGIGASVMGVAAAGFFVVNKRKNANKIDVAVARTEAAMADKASGNYAIGI